MSALLIVVVVAAVAIVALALIYARHASAERVIERDRLDGEVGAYRDRATASITRARELGREADEHRQLAEQHAELSDKHAATAAEHAERAAQLEGAVRSAGE